MQLKLIKIWLQRTVSGILDKSTFLTLQKLAKSKLFKTCFVNHRLFGYI